MGSELQNSIETIRSALKELRLLRPYGSSPSTEVAGQLHATYTLIRRRNGQLDDFIRRTRSDLFWPYLAANLADLADLYGSNMGPMTSLKGEKCRRKAPFAGWSWTSARSWRYSTSCRCRRWKL